ncbi:MAG: hypothetical protein Q8O94_02805 [bacterium]|nr:hypothetical protein [bacterium]
MFEWLTENFEGIIALVGSLVSIAWILIRFLDQRQIEFVTKNRLFIENTLKIVQGAVSEVYDEVIRPAKMAADSGAKLSDEVKSHAKELAITKLRSRFSADEWKYIEPTISWLIEEAVKKSKK